MKWSSRNKRKNLVGNMCMKKEIILCKQSENVQKLYNQVIFHVFTQWNMILLTCVMDCHMFFCRKCMFTKRHCRHWSTPSPAPRPTTLWCGLPHLPHTALSVAACCGGWWGRVSGVRSVGSSVTRSVKICSMQTVYSVSTDTLSFCMYTQIMFIIY